MKIDLEAAPTMNLTRGDEHERLAKLAGTWTGVARTWLDPTKPPIEEEFAGTAKLLLGGRFLRLEYETSLQKTPIAGELIVGFERDEGRWATAWIDSFHTGSAILVSHGVPRETKLSVFGEYYVKGEPTRWGWRTEIDPLDGFRIRMFNVSPDRKADLGVDERASSGGEGGRTADRAIEIALARQAAVSGRTGSGRSSKRRASTSKRRKRSK